MNKQEKNQKQSFDYQPKNYFELSLAAADSDSGQPLSQILSQLQKLQTESQQTHGVPLF